MTVGGSSNSAAQGCIECAPGTFDSSASCIESNGCNVADSSSCLSCSRGFYQMNAASTLCLPCIPGLFNDQTGQVNCKFCLSNYISEDSNSSECTSCPVGWSSEPGSTKCLACEAGTYSNTKGAACSNCGVGQYRQSKVVTGGVTTDTTTDPTTCVDCPAGWSSEAGSTKWYVVFIYHNTILLFYILFALQGINHLILPSSFFFF
mgnify:CR=1 FL=1